MIIALLLDTGLRLSELAGLRIGDLLPDGYLRVRGKGGKERLVPLATVTEARLPDYLAHNRPRPIGRDVDHVFLARDGRPLTSAAIQYALRRQGMRAGLDGVRTNPHTFRHTVRRYVNLDTDEACRPRARAGLAPDPREAPATGSDCTDACLPARPVRVYTAMSNLGPIRPRFPGIDW